MPASQQATREVLEIVRAYVPSSEIRTMLTELGRVRGSNSFRKTIVALQKEYERQETEK